MQTAPPQNPIALITGITGQDGSYLAELLLSKGYEVHGLAWQERDLAHPVMRRMVENARSDGKKLCFHFGDLTADATLGDVFRAVSPSEVYHLGGQSHVGRSFEIPEATCHELAMTPLRLLEICRAMPAPAKVFLASSAEVFGEAVEIPQTEETRFQPTSPYGCAKAFMTHIAKVYRESYGLFVCNGILYNHESPRRAEAFVTRKITRTVARIKLGLAENLTLGDTQSRRDWGHARDYVEAMWMMLQHPTADDYIVASGVTHSVQDFVEAAFAAVDLSWERYLVADPSLVRPAEPTQLVGNPAKIQQTLGWRARRTFEELVREMVEADMELAACEKAGSDQAP